MMRSAPGLALAVGLCSACTDSLPPTEPDGAQLAAWYAIPGVVQWEGGLEVGGLVFGCGAWTTQRPPEVPITVDLVFRAGVSVDNPGPTQQEVQAVRDHGGSIVEEFAFRGLRAILLPTAVEQLVSSSMGSTANAAYAAPPSGSSNFRVGVVVEEGALDTVVEAMQELGGVVTNTLANVSIVLGVMPVNRLLELAGTSGVRSVEAVYIGCLF